MQIRLPYPPSVNNYYFHRVAPRRHGKPFVQKGVGAEGKQYQRAVFHAVAEAYPDIAPSRARMSVSITTCCATRRRCDLDNVLKVILDSLTAAGIWEDDSQVDEISVRRGPVAPPNGHIDVLIERISAEPEMQKELAIDARP